jgi:hypothetical protein
MANFNCGAQMAYKMRKRISRKLPSGVVSLAGHHRWVWLRSQKSCFCSRCHAVASYPLDSAADDLCPRYGTRAKARTTTLTLEQAKGEIFARNTGEQSVYFVKCHDFVMIGYSSVSVAGRISSLQAGTPYALALVGTISAPRSCEAYLHKRFAKQRVRGEWFTLDAELQSFIDAYVLGTETLHGYSVPVAYVTNQRAWTRW